MTVLHYTLCTTQLGATKQFIILLGIRNTQRHQSQKINTEYEQYANEIKCSENIVTLHTRKK